MSIIFTKPKLFTELFKLDISSRDFSRISGLLWESFTREQKATIGRIIVNPKCPTYQLTLAKPQLLDDMVKYKLITKVYSDAHKADLITATVILQELFKHGSLKEYGPAPSSR